MKMKSQNKTKKPNQNCMTVQTKYFKKNKLEGEPNKRVSDINNNRQITMFEHLANCFEREREREREREIRSPSLTTNLIILASNLSVCIK